jgi:hypothetical protein
MIVGNLAVINELGYFDAILVDWYSATLSASVGVVWSWETQDETAEGYTMLGLNPTTVINTTEPITIMPRISNQSTSAETDWAIVADLSDIGNDFSGFSIKMGATFSNSSLERRSANCLRAFSWEESQPVINARTDKVAKSTANIWPRALRFVISRAS